MACRGQISPVCTRAVGHTHDTFGKENKFFMAALMRNHSYDMQVASGDQAGDNTLLINELLLLFVVVAVWDFIAYNSKLASFWHVFISLGQMHSMQINQLIS